MSAILPGQKEGPILATMKSSDSAPLHVKQRVERALLSVEGAQATLRWWQAQAASIEEDRRKVMFILPVGVALTFGLLPFFPRSALAVAAIAALATMQGLYLVTVHRWEFAHNVIEARKDVWIAQKKVSDHSHAHGAPPPGAPRGAVAPSAIRINDSAGPSFY